MIIPTVIGAIEAVWNISGAARDHAASARSFFDLSGTIKYGDPSEENVTEWRRRISSSYGEEPSVYHALNAECYNAATKALFRENKPMFHMKCHHYLLRNVWRFSEETFGTPTMSRKKRSRRARSR